MSQFRNLAILVVLGFSITNTWAQDICNDPRYQPGGFTLSKTDICHTENVGTLITNTANVDNALYLLNPKGESYEEIKIKGSDRINPSALTRTGTYTIIQIGKKDGKETVACKELNVRVGNSPIFSYNTCLAPVQTEISIPINPLNNYATYTIEINGNPSTITAADLPLKRKFHILVNNIKITGNGGGSLGCSAPSPTINVPRFGSTIDRNNEYYPQIKELRVMQDKTIELNITGMYDEKYDVFKYEAGKNPAVNPYQKEILIGKFTDPVGSDKSFCYYIKPNIRSFCILPPENISSTVCSIVLDEDIQTSTTQIELNWTRIESPNNYSGSRDKLESKEIHLYESFNGNFTSIKKNTNATSHTNSTVDCSHKYCYRLIETNIGFINSANFNTKSYSNQVCSDYKKDLPAFSPLYVSNEDNQNLIRFENITASPYDTQEWQLFKFDGTQFNLSESLKPPVTDLLFTDIAGTPTQSEQYKIKYIDECKNESKLSEPVSSVFLTDDDNNNLEWTKESPFDVSPVKQYDILYYNDAAGTQLIHTVTLSPQEFIHAIETARFVDTGNFKIKTISQDGTVSYSNIITLEVKGVLAIPNVFTPNGDMYNNLFEIKGSLGKVTKFKMEIFANNGLKVFESEDIKESWDGLYPNSQKAAVGTYYYRFTADMTNDQVIKKQGSFILLY